MNCIPGTLSSFQPQPLSSPLPPPSPVPPSHLCAFLMPFPPPVMPRVSPPCPSPLPLPSHLPNYISGSAQNLFPSGMLSLLPQCKVSLLKSRTFYFSYETHLIYASISCYCCCLVPQSCLTLYDTVDCSLPDSFCPWDFPGKNTGVGCYFLLQGIFPTQGSNPCLLHCR